MYLTAAEKERYFRRYEMFIWKVVHRFKARLSSHAVNEEDLFQECSIVLLKHAEASSTLKDLHRIPVRSMLYAMCCYVIGNQAASYPQRTSQFSKQMKRLESAVNYDDLENVLSSFSEEDILLRLDFEKCSSKLAQEESQIVALKRTNHTNREVSRTLGVTDVVVTRKLKRIRRSFEPYLAEE